MTNAGPSGTPEQHKYILDESEMPTQWYNLVADLPTPPPPPLHPGTHQPAGPAVFWQLRERLQDLLADPAPEPSAVDAHSRQLRNRAVLLVINSDP